MKDYIVFSDFHAHLWQEFAKPDEDYVNTRFKEQIEVLEDIFSRAYNIGATVIFAGDLFHKRNGVDTRVYNAVFNVFYTYREVPVIMIAGNHDKVTNKLSSPSSIDSFGFLPNVQVVTNKVGIIEDEHTRILAVPYGDETEDIKESIQNFEPSEDKANMLVAHLGVEGSYTGKTNHRLEGAFTYDDLTPDVFDSIVLGHYHKPQNLGDKQNNNHVYVGTPIQLSFNEEEQINRILHVQVNKNVTTTPIEIPSTKFITLEGTNIPENVEEYLDDYYVRFNGTREEIKALTNVREDLDNVRLTEQENYEIETRIDIDNSTDPTETTRTYMNKYYPKATEEALECIKEVI